VTGRRSEERERGIRCERCGGALVQSVDSHGLRCEYCSTHYLSVSGMTVQGDTHADATDVGARDPRLKAFGERVDALTPAGRLGRRRVLHAFQDSLRAAGVKGHAVERVRLQMLPFWQIEGKLVGWQRFEQPLAAPSEDELPMELRQRYESIEESLSREVVASFPACDVRTHGLMGIAHRVAGLRLRSFSLDELSGEHEACAVIHPASAALRTAREYHASRLAPANARGLKQRTTFVRTRLRIIYYPVWSLEYRSGGDAFLATIDGVSGRVLTGSRPAWSRDQSRFWLGAAAFAGWAAGLHWPLGLYALASWSFFRIRSAGRVRLMGWLSRELTGPRRIVAKLQSAERSS
jgi:hypothetical protein